MPMTFAHPACLWFLLLLAPLAWLAWRARPRRRVTAGSLLLWRRALELRGPVRRARWRRPEVFLAVAAAALGTLALAAPIWSRPAAPAALALCDRNCRLAALGDRAGAGEWLGKLARLGWRPRTEAGEFSAPDGAALALALAAAERRARPGAAVFWLGDRPPPEGLSATWLPVGASGDNVALCRAEVAGGRPWATVAAFTAAPWRGALAWGAASGRDAGRVALALAAGEARAVEVPATAADWRAGGGRLALWLIGAPAHDVLPSDDALTLEKARVVAIDAGRFPALARALRAAGADLAPPGAAADVAVVAAGAGEGEGARPRLATLAVAPLPAGGAGGESADAKEGPAPGAPVIARAPGGPEGRWLCPPLTDAWTAAPAFPLAVCRWLDGLTPPAGDADLAAHDCRPALPPAPALAAPGAGGAGGTAGVSLAPWLATLAALAALGLTALAWRRRPAPLPATKAGAAAGGGR